MDNATTALAQTLALESFHQDKDAIASSLVKQQKHTINMRLFNVMSGISCLINFLKT